MRITLVLVLCVLAFVAARGGAQDDDGPIGGADVTGDAVQDDSDDQPIGGAPVTGDAVEDDGDDEPIGGAAVGGDSVEEDRPIGGEPLE